MPALVRSAAIVGVGTGGKSIPTPPNHRAGYPDGTFHPNNNVTRGQLAKIAANAAGYSEPVTTQTFSDVPGADPLWLFIERAALHGIISGYTCGTAPAGACDNLHRPYFLAGNAVSRGQAAKFISNSFFPNCQTPRRQGASNHRLGDSTR